MKTVLRHTRTGLYFQGTERWTSDLSKAYDFHFADRALRFVESWNLRDVEVAFAFEEPDSVTSASTDRVAARAIA